MAQSNGHHTRKLARSYCRSLCRLYGQGKIADEEMEAIMADIAALRPYAHLPFWSQLALLPPGRRAPLFDKCRNRKLLASSSTADWLMAFVERGHAKAIGRAIREMDSFILRVSVEVPNYVKISDDQKCMIRRNLQAYYRRRGVDSFVRIDLHPVESEPKEPFVVPLVSDVFDAMMRSLAQAS
jgi:hypothetical protein